MIAKRKRWIVGILLCAVAVIGWLLLFPNNQARSKAGRLRRSLAKEGFKTDLAQFDFRTTPEIRDRAQTIIEAGKLLQDVLPFRSQGFFRPVGSNAAVVLSAEDALRIDFSTNAWPSLRRNLEAHQAAMDQACAAMLSDPVRFELDWNESAELKVDYIGYLRAFSGALAARVLIDLHEHRRAEIWTNLLALTRLATAWDAEPLEFAHLMKFSFATSAARATWEAQQQHALDRAELAALTDEWRRMKIFEGLPATAELSCAMTLQGCEWQRQQPVNPGPSTRQAMGDFFDSPTRGWSEMTSTWRQSRYRDFGSYEDEVETMKFYARRQRDLQHALTMKTWMDIRTMQEITNAPPAQMRGLFTSGRGINGRGGGFFGQRSLVMRAAETEARKRLVLGALALETAYLQHHAYPDSLSQLDSNSQIPADFMDGKSLRYRRLNAETFLLYSTGLDCVDDGGIALWERPNSFSGRRFLRTEQPDMLWPRAASAEEVLALASEPEPERRRFR